MTKHEWLLSPTARSVPEARRHVTRALEQWDLDGLVETAALLTSEIVTNAVLHARTDFSLSIERDGRGVRIAVSDRSPVPPAMRRHSDTSTTGRGLRLLEQLADAWRAEGNGDGKTVWFRLSSGRDPWTMYAGDEWLAEADA